MIYFVQEKTRDMIGGAQFGHSHLHRQMMGN